MNLLIYVMVLKRLYNALYNAYASDTWLADNFQCQGFKHEIVYRASSIQLY